MTNTRQRSLHFELAEKKKDINKICQVLNKVKLTLIAQSGNSPNKEIVRPVQWRFKVNQAVRHLRLTRMFVRSRVNRTRLGRANSRRLFVACPTVHNVSSNRHRSTTGSSSFLFVYSFFFFCPFVLSDKRKCRLTYDCFCLGRAQPANKRLTESFAFDFLIHCCRSRVLAFRALSISSKLRFEQRKKHYHLVAFLSFCFRVWNHSSSNRIQNKKKSHFTLFSLAIVNFRFACVVCLWIGQSIWNQSIRSCT